MAAAAATDTPARPAVLTHRGAGVLLKLERMMDDAARQLSVAAPSPAPTSTTGQQTSVQKPETFASAGGPVDAAAVSKN